MLVKEISVQKLNFSDAIFKLNNEIKYLSFISTAKHAIKMHKVSQLVQLKSKVFSQNNKN